MSFADELRKKSDLAPKEEQNEENVYLNEIYFCMKEGIVRCFLKKCYEEASRGGTSLQFSVDFMHIIRIIHEQERIYIKESDFFYVQHVMRMNRSDFKTFIIEEMKQNGFNDIKVSVSATKLLGYSVKISVSW